MQADLANWFTSVLYSTVQYSTVQYYIKLFVFCVCVIMFGIVILFINVMHVKNEETVITCML